jgi:glycerophosphoryl diester phosphodiesterase
LFSVLLLPLIATAAYSTATIAHRGFTTESHENTLEAIREAWMYNAEIVEVDVHLLQDGQLILFHDTEIEGNQISAMTYEELQTKVDYHIPKLDEALDEIPRDKSIILDLKSHTREFYEALVSKLNGQVREFEITIQSPSLAFLSHIKPSLPSEITYHYLAKLERNGVFLDEPVPQQIIRQVRKSELSGVSVKGRKFIDQSFVDAFRAEGLRFYVWTINDPDRIEHYTRLGVDGIITDNPNAYSLIEKASANQAREATP